MEEICKSIEGNPEKWIIWGKKNSSHIALLFVLIVWAREPLASWSLQPPLLSQYPHRNEGRIQKIWKRCFASGQSFFSLMSEEVRCSPSRIKPREAKLFMNCESKSQMTLLLRQRVHVISEISMTFIESTGQQPCHTLTVTAIVWHIYSTLNGQESDHMFKKSLRVVKIDYDK